MLILSACMLYCTVDIGVDEIDCVCLVANFVNAVSYLLIILSKQLLNTGWCLVFVANSVMVTVIQSRRMLLDLLVTMRNRKPSNKGKICQTFEDQQTYLVLCSVLVCMMFD